MGMRPASTGSSRARERGVALLIVLVVLFIVAVLMIDITLTATTARRSAYNASSDFLMDAAIEARYQVALAQLRYDYSLDQGKVDSPDDRWAREEYTRFESTKSEEEKTAAAEEAEAGGLRVLGDSEEVTVTVTIQDEDRKFNLNLLMHPTKGVRDAARGRLAILLDRFREDTPLDLSRTKAEELRDKVVDHLERPPSGEGEKGRVPLPKTSPWRILTPDELRLVGGLEDSSHGLGPEGILYDARDPEDVRVYMQDPEAQEPPEAHPGLLRYVTLWSGGAWIGEKPTPETWNRMNLVNVNTAEKPVLETLFYDKDATEFAANDGDFLFAERMVEYRGTPKEGSSAEGEEAAVDEPLAAHQYFEKTVDLNNVDGLDDTVLKRNSALKDYGVFKSETFSIDILAEHDGSTKQVRFVVRRHGEGFQTLLREERADPRFEEEKPPEEGEEPAESR